MKKGYSIINISIIVCFLALAVLVYFDYIKKSPKNINKTSQKPVLNKEISPKENKIKEKPGKEIASENGAGDNKKYDSKASKSSDGSLSNNNAAAENNSNLSPSETSEPKAEQTEGVKDGYYYSQKYQYEIFYPQDWPLKIRSDENISLGTVPPKNGQGAITIEVGSEDVYNEIEESKEEAAKYPGVISFQEEEIIVSGIKGDKLTITNNLSKTKDVDIIIEKDNKYYLLKYSCESPEFTTQAEEALATFKFK